MTTRRDPIGAPEAIEPPDRIDLGADSGLGRYVPDTFADDAAAGINAARACYFARRDSSPRRARRGHDAGTRDGSADDRPLLNDASRSSVRRGCSNAGPVNRPRELGYRKPALPLSFAIVVLVVSFVVFFLLAADHFAPKHNGRGRQNTAPSAQNR